MRKRCDLREEEAPNKSREIDFRSKRAEPPSMDLPFPSSEWNLGLGLRLVFRPQGEDFSGPLSLSVSLSLV